MTMLKPVLLWAIIAAAMLGTPVAATERPPRVGEQPIVPKKPADAKPAPETTQKPPVKRRAVRQQLDDDIRPLPTVPSAAPSVHYGPRLTPPGTATPATPGVPPAPILPNCIGDSCRDPNGGRFNGGVGTTLISPEGKLCNNNGMTVQCF